MSLIGIGNSADKRKEDRRFGEAVARVQVKPPIFILGHWRNGTTLLQELLILDDRFAYPNVFQVANPHTFLVSEENAARYLANMPAQARPMDNMQITFSSPGEDEAAIAMTCLRSPIIAWAFPKREAHYDRYYTFRGVPQREVEEWKAALVWFLKKLTLKNDRPMVLKSPPHTGRIRSLLELFPDARFIHISRDPYAVFRSTQRLYAKAVPLSYLQRPNLEQIDDGIIRRYAAIYDAYFEQQPLIPAGQFCDVHFEDLERDIVGQMGAIYNQLGLSEFGRLKPKLEQYASAKSGYQKNEHSPLAQPLRDKIANAWQKCFETWGYTI